MDMKYLVAISILLTAAASATAQKPDPGLIKEIHEIRAIVQDLATRGTHG